MPDRDDRALNQFWNDVVESGAAAAGDLDTETTKLVHRLQSMSTTPLPVSARERVWRGLMETYDEPITGKEPTMHTASDLIRPGPVFPNGSLPGIRLLDPPMRRHNPVARPLMYLAVAAIVLALLGGAAVVRFTGWGDSSPSRGGPAIHAPSTPSPEAAADATLLDLTLLSEPWPTGDDVGSGIMHFTIPPGTRSTWATTCCAGPMVDYVISGTYTVTADAPTQVLRSDGTTEELPAGTGAVLTSGDAHITRIEIGAESANTGSEPVELLSWVIGKGFSTDVHPGWIAGGGDGLGPIALLDEPLLVELRTITVVGGEVLAPAESGYRFIVSTTTSAMPGYNDDWSVRIAGTPGKEYTMYVITLHQAGEATGTPAP